MAMDTKLFVNQLNQITEALLAMTPAQSGVVNQSIQLSQAEIVVNELIQPLFNNLSQCPHYHANDFKKWEKQEKYKDTIVKSL